MCIRMCSYMGLCAPCLYARLHEGQKWASEPQGLELWVVSGHHVAAGNQVLVLWRRTECHQTMLASVLSPGHSYSHLGKKDFQMGKNLLDWPTGRPVKAFSSLAFAMGGPHLLQGVGPLPSGQVVLGAIRG